MLWHGTSVQAIPGIAAEGLLPISRTHVHLAAAVDAWGPERLSDVCWCR